MTRDDDPERMQSSSSPEDATLRALLAAGRKELPDASQLASLSAKLGPILGPGGGGGSGGAAGHGPAGTGGAASSQVAVLAGLAKAGAVVLVVSVAAVAFFFGDRRSRRPDLAEPAVLSEDASPGQQDPAPLPSAAALPAEPVPARATSASGARPQAVVPSSHAAPAELPSEVALLQRAQDTLATDPRQTLLLCGQLAKRFPDGLLVQEREVIAIDALVRMGRTPEAAERGRRFAAAYPSSPHLQRIETLLGKGL